MDLDFSTVLPYWQFYRTGLMTTIQATAMSVFFGFIWGTCLTLIKISKIKPLEWFAKFYTSIFRGTPLLVQLSIVYFAFPQLFGLTFTALEAGVFTFTLNSAAYISEIFRGGIQAIDKGQYEAAMALGVSYKDMMFDIVIPQAVRHVLPGLVNECIALLKESSLLAYIGVMDLLKAADQITINTYRYFEPYLVVAVIYYVLVLILSAFASALERRLHNNG